MLATNSHQPVGQEDPPPPVPLLACVPAPPGTTRLAFAWGLGPRLLLTPLGGGCSGGGRRRKSQTPPAASVVQWSALSALERRLVYDTLPALESLHTDLAAGAASRPDWPDRVRAYAADVSAQMSSPAEGDDDATADDAVAAARAEHAAWDWAGLLFLGSPRPDGAAGEATAAWLRTHAGALCSGGGGEGGASTAALAPAIARLLASPAPDADPLYWPTLARAASVGWVDDAVALLGAHGAWTEASAVGGGGSGARPPFAPPPGALDSATLAALGVLDPVGLLVRGQPRLGGGGAAPSGAAPSTSTHYASMADFIAARTAWLSSARRLACDGGVWERGRAGDAPTAEGCRALLRVLCAEPGAVDAAALGLLGLGDGAAASGGWPDLLAARCLHPPDGSPGPAGAGELAAAAGRAAADAAACPASPHPTPASAARDAMLLGVAGAAAAGEPAGAAAALSAGCSAWAMAAVTPVLYARGGPGAASAGGEPLPHAGGRSGEWWALDLASGLAGSAVTRPAAARLLASACPTHGRGGAGALFARAPGATSAGDDLPASRAAATAARIGLRSAEAGVCRAAGVAHWQAGRPGAALGWLGRAGDGGRAAIVASEAAESARDALVGQHGGGGAAAAAALVADLGGPLAGGERAGCGLLGALADLAAASPADPARLAAAVLATAASGPANAVPAALLAALPALETPPSDGGAVAAVPAATVEAMVALLDEAKWGGGRADGDDDDGGVVEGAVRLALARALARAYVAG